MARPRRQVDDRADSSVRASAASSPSTAASIRVTTARRRLGHQTLEPDGPTCGCGKPRLPRGVRPADRIAAACGRATVEEAIARARGGDAVRPRASPGSALPSDRIANRSWPSLARPGGHRRGVAASADLLLDTIRDELRRHVSRPRSTRSRSSPPSSGRGAPSARPSTAAEQPTSPASAPLTHRWARDDRDRIPAAYRPDIEQALREADRAAAAGDCCPLTPNLCAEFGVSRMTARNAMERLAADGPIRREPASGQLCDDGRRPSPGEPPDTFTQEMRRAGRVPSSRVLTMVVRPATPIEATSLGLSPAPADRPICVDSGRPMCEPIALDRPARRALRGPVLRRIW